MGAVFCCRRTYPEGVIRGHCLLLAPGADIPVLLSLGVGSSCPLPRVWRTSGVAPSLLFKKTFAVNQVLVAGSWRMHSSCLRHYLRVLALRSLATFTPVICGGVAVLGFGLVCSPGRVASLSLTGVYMSPQMMLSYLFLGNMDCILVNLSLLLKYSLIPFFSSLAPSIFMPGPTR